MAKGSKRAADTFLILNKLPLSLVNDKSFQDLLYVTNDAPSKAFVQLPSNDSVGRRARYL